MKKNPALLRTPVRATGWGDSVMKVLFLQMVAMAGEFDLREPIKEKKKNRSV